jgi:hippurate hydrolase
MPTEPTAPAPSFRDRAEALAPGLTALRHALHREPEIDLKLPLTQAKVLAALDGLPLEITTGKTLSSVVAVLHGGRPGPAVLLRGDMDALPLQELADVPYRSRFDGVMHACGHDQHVAMLVGAARLLCERREELPGSVVFMFQPGEESYDGARRMVEEGLLEAAGKPLVGAYSVHVSSNGPECGTFHGRVGTQTAGNAELKVVVRGKGGHGSTRRRRSTTPRTRCSTTPPCPGARPCSRRWRHGGWRRAERPARRAGPVALRGAWAGPFP